MSDPLINDGARAIDLASMAGRDAKIEQLLLVGLDHYFASQYEQAINVWTRALFFDRTHPRARAYIERARSALAERQRESEELLQNGVAAFHRGEASEARRLLEAAIANGAPSDEALAILHRLDRLVAAGPSAAPERPFQPARQPPPMHGGTLGPRSSMGLAGALGLVAVLVGAAYVVVSRDPFHWRAVAGLAEDPASLPQGPIAHAAALPLPRRGETALARARALAAGGHLRDALAALDLVRPTDSERPSADRLRSEIQRQLLAFGSPRRLP